MTASVMKGLRDLIFAGTYFRKTYQNPQQFKVNQTVRNKVMQPKTSSNHSRPIVLNHIHNQARFGRPIFNRRGFIYLGISKMVLTF